MFGASHIWFRLRIVVSLHGEALTDRQLRCASSLLPISAFHPSLEVLWLRLFRFDEELQYMTLIYSVNYIGHVYCH